jgi:uncharacterized membrane-anchored protein YjiN (DUF445 family)
MTEDEKSSFKAIYDTCKKVKAGSMHFRMNEIYKDKQAVGVMSVYLGEVPADIVLDKLVDWLHHTKNKEVLQKIKQLQNDLSYKEDYFD